MHFTLFSSALLCLLAAQLPLNQAGVVPARLECRGPACALPNNFGWSLSSDLSRRGGGGGGGKGGGGNSGGGKPGKPGKPGTPGKPEVHEGKPNEHCNAKRDWPRFWQRGKCNSKEDGNSPGDNPQPNAPVENPPAPPANAPVNRPANDPGKTGSARDNFGRPAQSQEQTHNPQPPINLANRITDIRTKIQNTADLQNEPFLFYSGFKEKEIVRDSVDALSVRLNVQRTIETGPNLVVGGPTSKPQMSSIQDVLPIGSEDQDFGRLQSNPKDTAYYWATMSRAYAQGVTGRVYIIIPKDRPINIPKDNGDGSAWWTFELPDLTRNLGVDSITLVSVDLAMAVGPIPDASTRALGPDKVIWKRGDAPIGTPGNELHQEVAPEQPWYG